MVVRVSLEVTEQQRRQLRRRVGKSGPASRKEIEGLVERMWQEFMHDVADEDRES